MFDPVSVVTAIRSGVSPKDTQVILADLKYIKNQHFQLRVGMPGAVIYAIIWLIVIPITGVVVDFLQNPLEIAALYLFGFATALGGLIAAFYVMPRALDSQSHQALILTPDGFTLANMESGAILRAVDYHAFDNLKLKVITDSDASDQYCLFMTQQGKTTRWTIDDYFQASPEYIANAIVHAYERARAAATSARP